MTITLTPDIEDAVTEQARRLGLSPETLVLNSLRTIFVTEATRQPVTSIEPRDDWERRLANIGVPTGVSLTGQQVSSEGIYQDQD